MLNSMPLSADADARSLPTSSGQEARHVGVSIALRRKRERGVQQPRRHEAAQRGGHEQERDSDHPELADENQFAAIDDVADGAGRQRKHKERQRRGRLRQRDESRAGPERQHQPRGPDALHEGAHVRDQVRDEQVSEQGRPERPPQTSRWLSVWSAVSHDRHYPGPRESPR
jgi:hypothetical protein